MPLKLSFEPVTHYKINLTSLFAKFKYILMHCTVISLFASRWHYSNGGAVLGDIPCKVRAFSSSRLHSQLNCFQGKENLLMHSLALWYPPFCKAYHPSHFFVAYYGWHVPSRRQNSCGQWGFFWYQLNFLREVAANGGRKERSSSSAQDFLPYLFLQAECIFDGCPEVSI